MIQSNFVNQFCCESIILVLNIVAIFIETRIQQSTEISIMQIRLIIYNENLKTVGKPRLWEKTVFCKQNLINFNIVSDDFPIAIWYNSL